MPSTRPALRLLQALFGLMLLVGAWQAAGHGVPPAGATPAGWGQADNSFAAFTDAGGGWIVGLAGDTASDLFDDGPDRDEPAIVARCAAAVLGQDRPSLPRPCAASPPLHQRLRASLSTGPPAA
jgi:hypothetical protein